MRSLSATQLFLLLFLPLVPALKSAPACQLEVLDFDVDRQHVSFAVPGCLPVGTPAYDHALVFSLQPQTCDTPSCLSFVVNDLGVQVTLPASGTFFDGPDDLSITANDTAGVSHTVQIRIRGYLQVFSHDRLASGSLGNPSEDLIFQIVSVDDTVIDVSSLVSFRVSLEVTPAGRRMTLLSFAPVQPFVRLDNVLNSFSRSEDLKELIVTGTMEDHASEIDIEAEVELLRLLEEDALELNAQIALKKQAIYGHIKDYESNTPLAHLLDQCTGILCKARVIAERLCRKMGIDSNVQADYLQIQSSQAQNTFSFHSSATKTHSTSSSDCHNGTTSEVGNATVSEKSPSNGNGTTPFTMGSTSAASYHLEFSKRPSTLIRALSVIASLLGLLAVISLIRRKCTSMRKRVERAADREERRNARAYRRAARRAHVRKQWNRILGAVSCFTSRDSEGPQVGIQDYEEKRALILQDAMLEQDLDQAEKGQIMEAEIRELRHAHEIVASLVRRSAEMSRYDIVDPPPPLVPLPYTPATRSRASTGTLPSYTSEALPGYTSTPDLVSSHPRSGSISNESSRSYHSDDSAPVADGFRHYIPTSSPSSSDEAGRYTPESTSHSSRSIRTGTTSRGRYTPTSSIPTISPRNSQETLWTGYGSRGSARSSDC